MVLRLIRSATLTLEYGGRFILVDPYLAPKFSRPPYAGKSRTPMVELPMPVEEVLHGVDLVIVSHPHSDHFDSVAREVLPRNLPLICQEEDRELIEGLGFTEVEGLRESAIAGDIEIRRVPGRHGSGAVLEEMGPAMGWTMAAPGEPRLYWIGDSVLAPEILATVDEFRPEVIVTHSCGATWGEGALILMDAAQTIELAKRAADSRIIATHMEAVDHATVSRQELRDSADRAGIGRERLLIPADGEAIRIGR